MDEPAIVAHAPAGVLVVDAELDIVLIGRLLLLGRVVELAAGAAVADVLEKIPTDVRSFRPRATARALRLLLQRG